MKTSLKREVFFVLESLVFSYISRIIIQSRSAQFLGKFHRFILISLILVKFKSIITANEL